MAVRVGYKVLNEAHNVHFDRIHELVVVEARAILYDPGVKFL